MENPQDAPDLAKLWFYPEKNPNRTSMKATPGGKLNVINLSTEIKTILSLFPKDKKETPTHL